MSDHKKQAPSLRELMDAVVNGSAIRSDIVQREMAKLAAKKVEEHKKKQKSAKPK